MVPCPGEESLVVLSPQAGLTIAGYCMQCGLIRGAAERADGAGFAPWGPQVN